jgi:hypothetical protein
MTGMRTPAAAAAVLVAALAAACADTPPVSGIPACELTPAPIHAPSALPDAGPFDPLFEAAGAEFGVPAELLRAIGWVETRWRVVDGHEEFPGLPAAYGAMALRGERLARGAELAAVSPDAARRDASAGIRAAAALLRALADEVGLDGDGTAGWGRAVQRFSGIELPAGREAYLADVRAALDGRVAPAARVAAGDPCGVPTVPPGGATDFAGALWRPTGNFNQRMAGEGGRIRMVIVHSCEGAYTGCWSWLASASSGVSAHYVVREDGAEITQLVRESDRAWHIGAVYDSTLNAGHAGELHGIQSNHFTIGVEHAGFASQTGWPGEQIDASARLVCDLARRWGIPRDALHIVSHAQLQPHNRTDPGAHFPWAGYLQRIDHHCAA